MCGIAACDSSLLIKIGKIINGLALKQFPSFVKYMPMVLLLILLYFVPECHRNGADDIPKVMNRLIVIALFVQGNICDLD